MTFLKAEHVCLDYPVYGFQGDSLRNKISNMLTSDRIVTHAKTLVVEGLKDVSFELKPGDALGIIGQNGAGKTSLLKSLSGIYAPTGGKITRQGSLACLLGTGFGLNDDATGYENIIYGGIALGSTIKTMRSKFEDIAEFTQLGEFLNMPMRSYSQGMRARLAFAIATSLKPDILVIDEGLGAGDASFFDKAQARLREFMQHVDILVFASHSEHFIRQFCNKILYMESGCVKFFGNLDEGYEMYHEKISQGKEADILKASSHIHPSSPGTRGPEKV